MYLFDLRESFLILPSGIQEGGITPCISGPRLGRIILDTSPAPYARGVMM